jgi:manganese/zinc/iron transport system ATP- binding protein
MLGVIGPNGAGKTTFIKSILELIPKRDGSVLFNGKSLAAMRNKIAYVAQRSSVDWDFPLIVFDMVLMGCYGKLGWFKHPGKAERANAYEALAAVGLEHYADASIGTLSGGQQQRAFVARALMQDADIYFLDEPFAGVDIPTEKIIISLFKKLKEQGKTIIVVHHDILTAPAYFDWGLLLNKKVVACGPIEKVLTQDNFMQVYGGNNVFMFK